MSNRLCVGEAEQLAQSWQLALRAERKSPQTLTSYGEGVRQYVAWCTENDVDPMVRANLNAWTARLLDTGAAAATARARQLGVRRFALMAGRGGRDARRSFLGVKSPKLDERVVELLTDDELRAMLKASIPPKGATPAEAFRHRHDEAMIRLMLESGMRAVGRADVRAADVTIQGGAATAG